MRRAAAVAACWLGLVGCDARRARGEPDGGALATAALTATTSSPAAVTATAAPATSEAKHAGMALVPAGPFTMGADAGGEPDEHPAHRVTLPAFWLDLTQVTNEDYGRCVAAARCPPVDATSAPKNHLGSDAAFRRPRQPVSAISWAAAAGYCAWVGKRLPTEAEFEKAARGEPARRYPWGDAPPTHDRCVFAAGATEEVGTHPAGDGPYGHHDLCGNVWEWVEDIYDPYAYRRATASEGRGGTCEESLRALDELRRDGKKGFTGTNPIPTECERVLRGGAFNYGAAGLRASNRVHHPERYRLVMAGFRCAASE